MRHLPFLALAVVLIAATPSPTPHKTPLTTFTTPKHTGKSPRSLSGADCGSGRMANAAAGTVNPVTGVKSNTIVSVPINGGDVRSATTHAQQAAACAHGR